MDLNYKTPTETLTPPSSPSQFAFTITRTAVSQICQYTGLDGSNLSALQTLTNIATIYLQTLGKIAATHATNANRTDSNLFDVILALEDLASVEGFRGAAVVPCKSLVGCDTLEKYILALEGVQDIRNKKSVLSSGTLVDIMNFVGEEVELPFAKPIPRFNSSSRRRRPPNSLRKKKKKVSPRDDCKQNSHIPRWLPPLPDRSTYETDKSIRFSKSIDSERLNSLRNCAGTSAHDWSAKGIDDGRRNKCKEEEDDEKRELGLLPEKRGRVRFKMGLEKMGVKLRNGLCIL